MATLRYGTLSAWIPTLRLFLRKVCEHNVRKSYLLFKNQVKSLMLYLNNREYIFFF